MRYILFLVLVLFILIVFSLSEDKLSKKAKISIVITVLFIGAFGYFFEKSVSKKQVKISEISLAFNQGKSVKCSGIEVNKTNFLLSPATLTFIAEQNASSDFKGLMFDLKECEVE